MTIPTSPIEEEVVSRMGWYDRKARNARQLFIGFRAGEIITAAVIPFFALLNAPAVATAGLGVLIAVLAGLEHIFRFQENWINYRKTCETLRDELFLYRAGAGPFANPEMAPDRLLAERVTGISAQEQAKWLSISQRAARPGPGTAVKPA